jgi:NADH:ubiquinone oxidoreductase subunit F (NADH-binding)
MVTGFLLDPDPVATVEEYLASDVGGRGLAVAHDLGRSETIERVRASGLRGRGGGGFLTGAKWQGIAGQGSSRRYVVCNGAEGEPGTFKDRALIRSNPYQVIEGLFIAAFAVDSTDVYVCVKASYSRELERLTRAIEGLQQHGLGTDLTVTIVAGPDDYLFGEEKAMLEVIEGKPPLPRAFPPYEQGLFAWSPELGWESTPAAVGSRRDDPHPTLVNNVETLANVPHIVARGEEWFRSMGTADSPGTVVCTVVGDVVAPDIGEIEMGTPLGAAIDAVGSGVHSGRSVKAVFSGVSNAVVPGHLLATPLSYEAMEGIGSGLGSAGLIVYDDTACMVEVACRFSDFLSLESCGQCSPCKLGSAEITAHLDRIEAGLGSDRDLEVVSAWLRRVTDASRCYLATEEQTVISSILRTFPEEFADHLERHRCPRPRSLPIPKLVELSEGRATYAGHDDASPVDGSRGLGND